MVRRGSKSRRRRQTNSSVWVTWNDWAGGVIGPGDRANWTKGNFSIPSDRDFCLKGFWLQVTPEPSSASQGALGGVCCQVSVNNMYLNESRNIWNTGPLLVGASGMRRRYFRVSGTTNWSKDAASGQVLLFIDNICQRANDTSSMRYILELDVRVSPEAFGRACPTLQTVPSSFELLTSDV